MKKYGVQVRVFHDYDKAMELQLKLYQMGLLCDIIRKMDLYTVNVGSYQELDHAAKMEYYLNFIGYNAMTVVNLTDQTI